MTSKKTTKQVKAHYHKPIRSTDIAPKPSAPTTMAAAMKKASGEASRVKSSVTSGVAKQTAKTKSAWHQR